MLLSNETAATYQKTLNLTGTILKETAQLIWLIICSAFVFGAWAGDTSMKTGSRLRQWVDQKGSPSLASAEDKSLATTGKSLLDQGKGGIDYLLNQAREQLGLEPVASQPAKTLSKASIADSATPLLPQADTPAPALEPTKPEPTKPELTKPEPTQSAPTKPAPEPVHTPTAGAPALDAAISDQPAARPVPNEDVSREPDDGGWPPQIAED